MRWVTGAQWNGRLLRGVELTAESLEIHGRHWAAVRVRRERKLSLAFPPYRVQ